MKYNLYFCQKCSNLEFKSLCTICNEKTLTKSVNEPFLVYTPKDSLAKQDKEVNIFFRVKFL